jgi:N-acyl homoserine lactone hydrolase
MRRWLVLLLSVGASISLPAAELPSLRLYVLDAGTLLDKLPVVAYVVVHPKGTLMWEAGAVPDATFQPGASGRRAASVHTFKAATRASLKSQLAKAGVTPRQVTFFATSHAHFDHIANAGDFAAATWLVQKAERDAMFAPTAPPFHEPAFYAALRSATTRVLTGDHDVFGDGTVILKATPGHTPGHQVLFVRLARHGPLVLGGDIYHDSAERERPQQTVPESDAQPARSKATRAAIEAFVKKTGAAFWIEHDAALFAGQKKAPEFYD